jgi:hypothetical protein
LAFRPASDDVPPKSDRIVLKTILYTTSTSISYPE